MVTGALRDDERPDDDTPVHTPNCRPRRRATTTSRRPRGWRRPPNCWRWARTPPTRPVADYKRRIGPWLLWRARPATGGDARYWAALADDFAVATRSACSSTARGAGSGPERRHATPGSGPGRKTSATSCEPPGSGQPDHAVDVDRSPGTRTTLAPNRRLSSIIGSLSKSTPRVHGVHPRRSGGVDHRRLEQPVVPSAPVPSADCEDVVVAHGRSRSNEDAMTPQITGPRHQPGRTRCRASADRPARNGSSPPPRRSSVHRSRGIEGNELARSREASRVAVRPRRNPTTGRAQSTMCSPATVRRRRRERRGPAGVAQTSTASRRARLRSTLAWRSRH